MKRILVVDDELLDLYARWIREEGKYEVAEDVDGFFSVKRHEKGERFDLIITDLQMPIFDGFQTIDTIRSTLPRQKFIMVSGCLGKNDRENLDRLHVPYLEKPVDPDKLFEAIESALAD